MTRHVQTARIKNVRIDDDILSVKSRRSDDDRSKLSESTSRLFDIEIVCSVRGRWRDEGDLDAPLKRRAKQRFYLRPAV